jgi:hypothetical protein
MKYSSELGQPNKQATRFCGPFEILDRIGLVAYMLAFPASMNVHNVFHVSLLKNYVHDPNHVKNYIHWKHQLPLFFGCNWKEASNPYFQATT